MPRRCRFVCLDVRGISHKISSPLTPWTHQEFCLHVGVLSLLCRNLGRKCPDLWQSGDWFLHHDNALVGTALSFQQFSTSWCMTPPIIPVCPLSLPQDLSFVPPNKKEPRKGSDSLMWRQQKKLC